MSILRTCLLRQKPMLPFRGPLRISSRLASQPKRSTLVSIPEPRSVATKALKSWWFVEVGVGDHPSGWKCTWDAILGFQKRLDITLLRTKYTSFTILKFNLELQHEPPRIGGCEVGNHHFWVFISDFASVLLLMAEILYQLHQLMGCVSQYLQGFRQCQQCQVVQDFSHQTVSSASSFQVSSAPLCHSLVRQLHTAAAAISLWHLPCMTIGPGVTQWPTNIAVLQQVKTYENSHSETLKPPL